MGVYIPDMKMPSSCLTCDIPVRVQPCPMDHDNVSNYKTSRHPDCPLIPVPPHGRLIDADALTKQIKRDGIRSDPFVRIVCDYFKDAPTVIPAEEDESDG